MKFILIETIGGMRFPYLFPDLLEHSAMAERLASGGKVVDAGFCVAYADQQYELDGKLKVRVWGTATSLKLQTDKETRAETQTLLRIMFNQQS
jgi:hypothetical protein